MEKRRDFIKKAMLLSGAVAWDNFFPESIARAATITPEPGSTFLDAEHVVILMQENRSFDHCFGTLQGVRGFNDPRYIHLPDGKPVWLQTGFKNQTYSPFRYDIHGTSITWMGGTPHGRHDQVDAYNGGLYDQWIDAKGQGSKKPLTMGYYTRKDIPFNYALADAFTVCDQAFCSAMTSTWPNRLYLWSGTIRGDKKATSKAYIRNDIPWGEADWTTFPEILEQNSVSWKVYQNDLTTGGAYSGPGGGYKGAERDWLANYTCNPLEYQSQFKVRFNHHYRISVHERIEKLNGEIVAMEKELATALPALAEDADAAAKKAHAALIKKRDKQSRALIAKKEVLQSSKKELEEWSEENFKKLDSYSKNLHEKAFTTNSGDPKYNSLTELEYEVDGEKRKLEVPAGDVLYQFRKDVSENKLPAVSWLVSPRLFSNHPSSPWFGNWMVSEIIDILIKDPEVWKKTIFILTYDENDGYFDHQPPFMAPDPKDRSTGFCSKTISTAPEWITQEQELAAGVPSKQGREAAIGLGYRIPMVVASPWTRGGKVCSEVFDHTSVIRFVIDWLNQKNGTKITEGNITDWRKAVCGNLQSAFRRYDPDQDIELKPLEYQQFMIGVHKAKFMPPPPPVDELTEEQIAAVCVDPSTASVLPRQEPGTKPSLAIPYQLTAWLSPFADGKTLDLALSAGNEFFGKQSAGGPFNVYFYNPPAEKARGPRLIACRRYAVAPGDELHDEIPLSLFEGSSYDVRVFGPNGFYREFRGGAEKPGIRLRCDYERDAKDPTQARRGLTLLGGEAAKGEKVKISLVDNAYGAAPVQREVVLESGKVAHTLDLSKSEGWYDITLTIDGVQGFSQRYAGRVETGEDGITDPFMGKA